MLFYIEWENAKSIRRKQLVFDFVNATFFEIQRKISLDSVGKNIHVTWSVCTLHVMDHVF